MMTTEEKLAMVKAIMGPDAPDDSTIESYLTIAKNEILQWRFSYNPDDMPEDVPADYEMTQVYAVVNGFTQRGVEGQTVSVENGVHRHFAFPDMIRYIRANVIALAKIPGASITSSKGSVPKAVKDYVEQYVDDTALTVEP